ncbi:MAG TPA: glycosyltransferase family 2 protein [Pseudacidobacterium sp.]|jgi:glycosyltransferase involved in cell wall biosynthesis|nr:glycosyltransferase family 2 protein [Pseudacidobacterium sp.]
MHLPLLFTVIAWIIAFLWIWRATVLLGNLPKLPDLLLQAEATVPATKPFVSVIVPACNEEKAIEQTLRSLLAQEGVTVEILAVNDRSTDSTGSIMERVAAEASNNNLRVIHVKELPAGWMGKIHAMALAARQASAPWLLFTDADVVFREDCLRRALHYAGSEADHFVLSPTLILKTFGERMMLAAIQALTFITWRPWKIADPESRDSIGIGAFNLIRSDVYRSIGGFESLRLEVLEDLRFGHLVKQSGYRQRFVLGRDLIRIHWAAGAIGIVRNLTKNVFAIFRFKPWQLSGAGLGLGLFCLVPVIAIFGSWSARVPALIALAFAAAVYGYIGRKLTGVSVTYVLTLPVAACFIMYALFRSMLVTLVRGGVVWRGTFYPLADLRKHAGPLR